MVNLTLKLFNVTPSHGKRAVPVLAQDMREARAKAKSEFRSDAKLKAKENSDIKVGDNLARPVRANRGIEVKYRRALERMVDDMHNSFQYWLTAAYKKYPPRLADLAQDAAPSNKIQEILRELAERWIKRFDEAAPKIADAYMRSQFKATDSSFQSALRDAGWTVKFQTTPTVRDALNASLNENVGLIRSIPQEYLTQVQGTVMRSYSAGRDLATMVKEIKAIYPKAAYRAIVIARDQSNKANAVINRARSLELGITDAIWMHSGGGKTPRPGHLKAGQDKRRFKIAKGCYIDGEYIQPGQLINCRCTMRVILPV